MKTPSALTGCFGCSLNRRNFIASGCAAGAGAAAYLTAPGWLGAAEAKPNARIRIVYALHAAKQAGPDWPNKGFDFNPVMQRITSTLTKGCKNLEFVTALANGPEQAQKILDEDKAGNIDGYIVYQMNCWNRVVQTIATSGKPVLYADFQYGGSGGFLVYTAAFLRSRTPNVGFVASSDPDDLIAAAKCFEAVKPGGTPAEFAAATARVRAKCTPTPGHLSCKPDELKTLPIDDCVKRLKEAKILAVRGQESGPAGTCLTIPVVNVPFAEVNEAWKNADKDEANLIAYRWEKGASQVTGVDWATLVNCAAMYLGQKAVLKKYGANAITINCLGGFYGGHIHAYPCLGFHQLNNEGLVGGCECDVRSAATMVAFGMLTQGRPGYISDPVMDCSKRQIIYAHCVASNRVFGPESKPNPYQILTHSEDRQGASVRSLLPTGYMTTTLEANNERKELLLHRAKAVENDPNDRACRTKLGAEPVGDFEKLFTQWDQWGWHRVTFYGDLRQPANALAEAIGWKVVEEA